MRQMENMRGANLHEKFNALKQLDTLLGEHHKRKRHDYEYIIINNIYTV
jgi:hypothetical protein